MTLSSVTLSRWYGQLGQSLAAGLTVDRALSLQREPSATAIAALRQDILTGGSLDEALERSARWIPPLDRQMIVAAAQAGRLPDMLGRLASRHEATSRAARLALLAGLYPVFVVHFAVVALNVHLLVEGAGLAAFGGAVLRLLVPVWLLGGLGAVALRRRWRIARLVLDGIPLLRGFRRFRALADLAFVLEAQLLAGVRLEAAWTSAAAATGDRRLQAIAEAAARAVRGGSPVGPVLETRRELPVPFAAYYASGEQTGQLDESLVHLQRHFADRAGTRLKLAALTYPNLLFLAAAVAIAVKVVQFWMGYFRQFDQLP